MKRIIEWVEHRTGARELLHEALYENIPSGARFRYVTGSMLVFAFVVQVITGIFLWMAYSPSSGTAWESVYYIQYEMTGGWLLRGVHHFMAQAMIVVMGLHLLQVIIDGAYRAPREVNYWLGIVLMQIVLGLGLTGYLLPWDQKGYWATNVATNLMTLVPFVGQDIQKLALGGGDYGHHTLTRFFAMHAGVLPVLLVVFLAAHVALFRRHGIHARRKPDIVDRVSYLFARLFGRVKPDAKDPYARADQYFWPTQVLYDGIACLVMLIVVLLLVVHFDVPGMLTANLSVEHRGAELGAPADPSEQYSAARPEWYFLFLFQLLKFFPGESEFIGAIVIPGVIMAILTLAPIIGIPKIGHYFNVAFVLVLLVGAGVLTGLAVYEDWDKQEFIDAKLQAEVDAARVKELIKRTRIDDEGEESEPLMIQERAVDLQRNDPLSKGPALFKKNCGSCHAYRPPDKTAELHNRVADFAPKGDIAAIGANSENQSAPNLYGYASRAWIAGLLDPEQVSDPDYFGKTAHKDGRMAEWVKAHLSTAGLSDEKKKALDDTVKAVVAALSAQAKLPSQAKEDAADTELIAKGEKYIRTECAGFCHQFGHDGQLGRAPDLTGYGSYEWMLGLISDPTHERFYGKLNDRMPSFAKDLTKPATHTVSLRELSLIVDFIRGDYYQEQVKPPVLAHDPEYGRKAVEIARMPLLSEEMLAGARGAHAPDATNEERAEHLFRVNCSGCHRYVDPSGEGISPANPSAPNLYGFASRAWLRQLLDPAMIGSKGFFGSSPGHKGGEMTDFVDTSFGPDAGEEAFQLREQVVIALSAEAKLPYQKLEDAAAEEDGTIEKGKEAITEGAFDGGACVDCHKFHDSGDLGSYPDLTGYGSLEWIKQMIANPENERHYAEGNDRMPAFAGENGDVRYLSDEEIELLAHWIRRELKPAEE